MLDTETKRRIDTARDILVGKVPDPKSQVEQITIALVYKFMDDMDQESIEMGGRASFFTGEFERFAWSKIFDPRKGGYDMLALYSEAIQSMGLNPNLPQLFRDIFKNAYLPYRDPETLKLFLKTINEFKYDHSERLGDAFEYLLSVLGSQGDAGQFRTPRHLIDFMVEIIQPQKNEIILDPACGTAGFLISAYKHILRKHGPDTPLTMEERKQLLKNFKGYDISPDMVRLSLVNMYLHGFVQPQIYEYDTLSSEDRWNDYADVILANPPFMSPKGGIRPHKRFSVQSNRSEVLFVDYMAEHLTPNGRAAIIVPEGIIFQSAGAYKQLRKYLVEQNYLWAVVSLPAGIFQPYSGVKTSILLLDRALAKKIDQILFVKVEADGFDLGAQRRPIDKNDFPDVIKLISEWKISIINGNNGLMNKSDRYFLISKNELSKDSEYNFNGEKYKKHERLVPLRFPLSPLGELCEILDNKRIPIRESDRKSGIYPYYGASGILDYIDSYIFDEQLVLIGEDGAKWDIGDKTAFIATGKYWVNNHAHVLRPREGMIIDKLLVELINNMDLKPYITGVTVPKLNQEKLRSILIPLPPLEVQREIVAEIEGYQRIIDGARQVVENWKPNIELELEEERKSAGVDAWPVVKLGEVCEKVLSGGTPTTANEDYWKGEIPWISSADIVDEYSAEPRRYITEDAIKNSATNLIPKGNIIVVTRVGLGKLFLNSFDVCISQDSQGLIIKRDKIIPSYLLNVLLQKVQVFKSISQGSTIQGVTKSQLLALDIALPPIANQHEMVKRIDAEREVVQANRRLIQVYEGKIKKVIERVWEG